MIFRVYVYLPEGTICNVIILYIYTIENVTAPDPAKTNETRKPVTITYNYIYTYNISCMYILCMCVYVYIDSHNNLALSNDMYTSEYRRI